MRGHPAASRVPQRSTPPAGGHAGLGAWCHRCGDTWRVGSGDPACCPDPRPAGLSWTGGPCTQHVRRAEAPPSLALELRSRQTGLQVKVSVTRPWKQNRSDERQEVQEGLERRPASLLASPQSSPEPLAPARVGQPVGGSGGRGEDTGQRVRQGAWGLCPPLPLLRGLRDQGLKVDLLLHTDPGLEEQPTAKTCPRAAGWAFQSSPGCPQMGASAAARQCPPGLRG